MIGYQLPPVGETISLKKSQADYQAFTPGKSIYLDSGTSALALAIQVSIRQARLLRSIGSPEVILPAYACPDLVSAVIYAGAKPKLVDFQYASPHMDLDALESLIGIDSVAIIAVNFLGISESLPRLRQVANKYKVTLIEDNAQAVPFYQNGRLTGEPPVGDIAIMSFGRGKPISLLGGGVLYSCNEEYIKALYSLTETLESEPASHFKHLIKISLYNGLINPHLYWLPANLSFLNIGKVVYKPLNKIARMGETYSLILRANVNNYLARDLLTVHHLIDGFRKLTQRGVVDLGGDAFLRGKRMLRYPILLPDTEVRDHVFYRLEKAGLGVSTMYGKPLNQIKNVESLVGKGAYPNADDFAERLITLPISSWLSGRHVRIIHQVITDSI